MKWTSFTQLRMEIIKTIKNREVTICNHQPSQPQRRTNHEKYKNYFNNEKEKTNII